MALTEVEKAQPTVLPANFASWDEGAEVPELLPDDFSDFDQDERTEQTPAPEPVPAVALAKAIKDPVEAPKPETRTVVVPRQAPAAQRTKAARLPERPARVVEPVNQKTQRNSQPEMRRPVEAVKPQLKNEEPESKSGGKGKLIAASVAALVILGGGASMMMHKSSKQMPANQSATMAPASSTPSTTEKPAAGSTSAAASTVTPASDKDAQQTPQQDAQGNTVKSAMMTQQLNAPSRIGSDLGKANSQEAAPTSQAWIDNGNNSGNANVFGSHQGPNVKMVSAPSQVSVSEKDAMSRLTYRTSPAYPRIAQTARVAGVVALKVTINKAGNVDSTAAISGPTVLRQAAADAVKQWRYRPYMVGNQPVAMDTTVNIAFSLQ
jgi:protein TonB